MQKPHGDRACIDEVPGEIELTTTNLLAAALGVNAAIAACAVIFGWMARKPGITALRRRTVDAT